MAQAARYMRDYQPDPSYSGQHFMPPHPDRKMLVRGFHVPTGSFLIFSKDINQATLNLRPGFDCCARFQVQFFRVGVSGAPEQALPVDMLVVDQWLDCFYGEDKQRLWCSKPTTMQTNIFDIWTFRLFTHPLTGWPIPEIGSDEAFRDGLGWLPYPEMKEFRAMRDREVKPQ